jgi:TRAP-type mannitol/chloroaromatic compound transport system permease small subunit
VLKKLLHGIDKISENVGKADSFLLIIIIFATFYEVIARYFVGKPTSWSNDLSSHVFAVYMTLGGAYVLMRKGHVTMDIVFSRLKPRAKAIIELLTFVVGASFLVVLIWKGGAAAAKAIATNEHATSVWAPSMIPFRLCMPIGAALFLLQYVAGFIRSVIAAVKGDCDL